MIDVQRVRHDFPILNQPNPPVYFDNACMSLRPQSVIDAITSYYTTMSACAGRSNHRLAQTVAEAVTKARHLVAQFIHAAHPEEIIFTRNTSEALNLLANSLELKSGDVVVLSDKEHNSNLVPWLRLQDHRGIDIRIVKDNQWQAAIDHRVKVVSCVFTSNLDGTSHPIAEITKLAHQVGAVVIVDAAQAVAHQPINVQELDIDYLAFSAHKMCGPSGMGVMYGKQALLEKLEPYNVGGDTVARTTYDSYTMLPIPEKFEAGLQDYAGIIGTGAAVEYLQKIGLQNIHEYEVELNTYLTDQMKQFTHIQLLGPLEPKQRAGIYAFTVEGMDFHQLALMLDQLGNIQVRSGQHCVHSWFNDRNLAGSVRASLYFYNTRDEIDHFITTLKKIMSII